VITVIHPKADPQLFKINQRANAIRTPCVRISCWRGQCQTCARHLPLTLFNGLALGCWSVDYSDGLALPNGEKETPIHFWKKKPLRV